MDQLVKDIIMDYMNRLQKWKEDIFKEALYQNAIPPIKGEVTAGKIRWRGIKVHCFHDGSQQLLQRGKPISPLLVVNDMFNLSTALGGFVEPE